jgi:DNA repair exonuclease SbcCD ATPase subunit
VSEINPLLEIAVNRISKRLNMPPDQVRSIIKPLFEKKDVVKEYEELSKRIDALKELFAKLPEEARAHVLTHVIRSEIAKSTRGNTMHASDVAVVRELLRGMGEDPEVKALRDEVKALRDMVSRLVEEQAKKSVIDEFKKDMESLYKRIEELEKKLSQQPQPPEKPRAEFEEFKKMLEEKFKSIEERLSKLEKQPEKPPQEFKTLLGTALKELDETLKLAKQYGLVKEGSGGEGRKPSIDEMVEELKKYGYEVKKSTMTREELERLLEEARQRAREEALKEAEIAREQAQQVGNIITTLIKEIGGPVVRSIAEAQREYMREALRARILQQYQLQHQQTPQQVAQQSQTTQQQPQQEVKKSAEREGQGGGGQSGQHS